MSDKQIVAGHFRRNGNAPEREQRGHDVAQLAVFDGDICRAAHFQQFCKSILLQRFAVQVEGEGSLANRRAMIFLRKLNIAL